MDCVCGCDVGVCDYLVFGLGFGCSAGRLPVVGGELDGYCVECYYYEVDDVECDECWCDCV